MQGMPKNHPQILFKYDTFLTGGIPVKMILIVSPYLTNHRFRMTMRTRMRMISGNEGRHSRDEYNCRFFYAL